MKITEETHQFLAVNISGIPPETGGILGSSSGDIIDRIIIDVPFNKPTCTCSYSPNTNYLNGCINSWLSIGIQFMGIFHTHFAGIKTLSDSDKEYITQIMKAMPDEIVYLFFPVYVLPNKELVCYRAEKRGDLVLIEIEALEIL